MRQLGLKKPNQLGLYDCTGNVWEWCYDTTEDIEEGKNYIYKAFDSSNRYRRLKGGSCLDFTEECVVLNHYSEDVHGYSETGLRFVRTVQFLGFLLFQFLRINFSSPKMRGKILKQGD